MIDIEEEFRTGAHARLTDGIIEAMYLSPDIVLSEELVRRVWGILPEHVKDEARCYGMSDTVFGDLAFEWIRRNPDAVWSVINEVTNG